MGLVTAHVVTGEYEQINRECRCEDCCKVFHSFLKFTGRLCHKFDATYQNEGWFGVFIYQNGNSDARLTAAKNGCCCVWGRRLKLKRLTASRLVAANVYQNPYSPDWPNTDNPELSLY